MISLILFTFFAHASAAVYSDQTGLLSTMIYSQTPKGAASCPAGWEHVTDGPNCAASGKFFFPNPNHESLQDIFDRTGIYRAGLGLQDPNTLGLTKYCSLPTYKWYGLPLGCIVKWDTPYVSLCLNNQYTNRVHPDSTLNAALVCKRECPSGQHAANNECVCDVGFMHDGTCVASCPTLTHADGNACVCSHTYGGACVASCPPLTIADGNACVCTHTYDGACVASCPLKYHADGNVCVCTLTNSGACVASCPLYKHVKGNTCVLDTQSYTQSSKSALKAAYNALSC